MYAIERHESLAWMRDFVPRLQRFINSTLVRPKAPGKTLANGYLMPELDDTRLVLAHKDLHFGNVMLEPATGTIAAILNWEFECVVPACRWNPSRAFLWSGKYGEGSQAVNAKWIKVFVEDAKMNEYQEAMQTVVNHVRAIVEGCPRGEEGWERMARGWRRTVMKALDTFNV